MLTKLFFLTLLIFSVSNAQEMSLKKLDERITDLELLTIKNKINFGVELKNIFGHFSVNRHDGDSTTGDGSNLPSKYSSAVGALIYRLKINSELNERVKVYAGAQMVDVYNGDFNTNDYGSENRSTQYHGNDIYLYKAYTNIVLTDRFVFSAGRLPTTYGPPHHIADGQEREGTYPFIAYSVPLDGVALSAKWNNRFTTRTIYSYSKSLADRFSPWESYTLSNPTQVAGSSTILTQMFEFNDEQRGLNFILQGTHFSLGAFEEASTVSYASSSVGYETFYISPSGKKLIKGNLLTAHLELEKPLGLPLISYLSITKSWSESLSNICTTTVLSGSADATASCSPYLVSSNDNKAQGVRLIIGSNYNFTDSLSFGAEYMDASKYSIPVSLYTDNLFNFNYLNGEAYHLYSTKTFYNRALSLRVGYFLFDKNATTNSSQSYVDSNENIQHIYMNLGIRI